MARRRSLTVQISAFISVFIAFLVGVIILLTGFRLSREIKDLVISDNRQIALARASELGEMMDKLTWQLRVMSSRPDLSGGERGVIEGFVQSQVSFISPEVVGLMYIWKNGDYVSSAKASGNVSDRDYCRALVTENKAETVGKAIISKSLNVPIIVTGVGIKGSDGVWVDRRSRGNVHRVTRSRGDHERLRA